MDSSNQVGFPSSQGTHDRYLPIIINLEQQDLLDEQTSSIIKNMILEENLEVFSQINTFIARLIDENELCAGLIRLAQMQGSLVDRPVSPNKSKQQLTQFVNSLAKYHF